MAAQRYKMPQFTNSVNIPGYGRIETDGGGWFSTSDTALQAKLVAAGAISETEITADNTGSSVVAGKTTMVQTIADTNITPDHVGKQLYNDSATNITLTIKKTANLSAGQAWTPGDVIAVSRFGAGTVTIAVDAGGTLNNIGTKVVTQNDTPIVIQVGVAADTFNLL